MQQQEILSAIAAHAKWKHQLIHAIESKEFEAISDSIKSESAGRLGEWLYDRVHPAQMGSPHYKRIVQLHNEFQEAATEVYETAVNGDQDAAVKLMSYSSPFSLSSAQLTLEMMKWQESLQ